MSREARFMSLSLSSQSSSHSWKSKSVEGSTSQRKASTKKWWSSLSEGVAGLRLYRAQNARLLWHFLTMARKKLSVTLRAGMKNVRSLASFIDQASTALQPWPSKANPKLAAPLCGGRGSPACGNHASLPSSIARTKSVILRHISAPIPLSVGFSAQIIE
jgi:hypothetical protein